MHGKAMNEKIVVICFLIIFFENIILVTSSSPINSNDLVSSFSKQPNTCITSACNKTASVLLKNMDRDVDPCEDFYKFACGKYMKNVDMPEDYDHSYTISHEIRKQVERGLNEPIDTNEPNTFKVLKYYFKRCREEETISPEQFLEMLKNFGGWPVLVGKSWDESNFHLIDMIAQFRKFGYRSDYFLFLTVGFDPSDNRRFILQISPPRLPKKKFLLQGIDSEKSKNYEYRIRKLVNELGSNNTDASQEISDLIIFEQELTKIVSQSSPLTSSILTLNDLRKEYPIFPWNYYFEKMLFSNDLIIEDIDYVKVYYPRQMKHLIDLLNKTPKRVLANYAIWRFSQDSFLTPQKIKNIRLKSTYLKKFCLKKIFNNMSPAVNIFYIKKYYDNSEMQEKIMSLIEDIKESFKQLILKADWLDDETRENSLKKLREMKTQISFLSNYTDTRVLDDYYKDLFAAVIDQGMKMVDIDRALLSAHYKNLYRKRPDNMELVLTFEVDSVNAFYNPSINTINFFPGIFQGVNFDENVPNYMNYGAFGMTIGHEITHAFDSLTEIFGNESVVGVKGANSDQKELAKDQFLNRSNCIVSQYNKYIDNTTQLNLNGTNTLRENIADNSGLKAAYLAYDKWERKNGPEHRLPNFESYTPKQMFWISFAHAGCSKFSHRSLYEIITRDQHTIDEFRVIGSLHNRPDFVEDFDCPVGSGMNPASVKCEVWRK